MSQQEVPKSVGSPEPAHDPTLNRASVASISSMPVITENGLVHPAYPRMPLRVPQRSPRRSLIQSHPSTYIPSSQSGHGQEGNEGTSSTGAESPMTPKEEFAPDEKVWLASRERSRRFVVIVVVALLVFIGLAVGLGVGLTSKKNQSHSSDSSSSDSATFPAGNYSFDATLTGSLTNCTTRATSWGCSLNKDTLSNFNWAIEPKSPSTYTISSAGNPFGPNFKDLPVELLDQDKASERLVFSFSMNKTVIPSDAQTPTNRAAKCQFSDITFEATLWTRQKGSKTIDPSTSHYTITAWPGNVEIMQIKNSTLGSPQCEDVRGSPIADVQASGIGSCECQYANFDPRKLQ